MRDTHHIIEEYRQSDVVKRMYLFLEFRDLRGQFSEIDRKEGFVGIKKETDPVESFLGTGKSVPSNFFRQLKLWGHRFGKCFQSSS